MFDFNLERAASYLVEQQQRSAAAGPPSTGDTAAAMLVSHTLRALRNALSCFRLALLTMYVRRKCAYNSEASAASGRMGSNCGLHSAVFELLTAKVLACRHQGSAGLETRQYLCRRRRTAAAEDEDQAAVAGRPTKHPRLVDAWRVTKTVRAHHAEHAERKSNNVAQFPGEYGTATYMRVHARCFNFILP